MRKKLYEIPLGTWEIPLYSVTNTEFFSRASRAAFGVNRNSASPASGSQFRNSEFQFTMPLP